jgi:hypothetical protein
MANGPDQVRPIVPMVITRLVLGQCLLRLADPCR